MKPTLERIIEYQRLLLQFSHVERKVHRKHGDSVVFENDTEHSYNLAMTAWYMALYFPALNKDLVIRYALAHDVVEVHAGDTYIYGTDEELSTKVDREAAALEKLARDWPDFKDLTDTITEYEKRKSPEAKFIYALDKIMPILVIYIHDGYTWKQEGITAQMLYDAKIKKVGESPEILPYFKELYDLLLEHPEVIPPR